MRNSVLGRGKTAHRSLVFVMALTMALLPALGTYTPAQAALSGGAITVITPTPGDARYGEPDPDAIFVNFEVSYGGGSFDDWRGTEYRWDPTDTWKCADTQNIDFDSVGQTANRTFGVNLPTNDAWNTLYLRPTQFSDCTGDTGSESSLAGAIPPPIDVIDSNDDIPPLCGIDILMILDESNSIWRFPNEPTDPGYDPAEEGDGPTLVKEAVNAFLDSLAGTGSEVAITEFNDQGRLLIDYTPVTGSTIANEFATALTNYFSAYPDGQGGTNWQAGLQLAYNLSDPTNGSYLGRTPPLILFFTDGVPTWFNQSDGGLAGPGGSFTQHGLTQAAAVALNIKQQLTVTDSDPARGPHIFGIGVGETGTNDESFIPVTGPDVYDPVANPGQALTGEDDYTIPQNFDALADAFRTLALSACQSSLTVTKVVDDDNDPSTQATAAEGWEFSATVDVPADGTPGLDYTWVQPLPGDPANNPPGQTQSATTNANGTATFQWDTDVAEVESKIVFEEVVQPDYYYDSIDCQRRALDGTKTNLDPTPTGDPPLFTISDLLSTESATCEVLNIKKPKVLLIPDCSGIEPWVDEPTTQVVGGEVETQDTPRLTNPVLYIEIDEYFEFFASAGNPIPDTYISSSVGGVAIPDSDISCVVDNTASPNLPENSGTDDQVAKCTLNTTPPAVPGNSSWRVEITVDDNSPPGQTEVDVVVSFDATETQYQSLSSLPGQTESCFGTTPVELSYFEATPIGGGTHFEWSTASEVRNMGFNLYAETDGGLVKLNSELILSKVGDSFHATDYSFDAGAAGESFILEDVDALGNATQNGPFALGQTYGARFSPESIPWDVIQGEVAAGSSEQQRAVADEVNTALSGARTEAEVGPLYEHAAFVEGELDNTLFLPAVQGASNGAEVSAAVAPPVVNLLVDKTGLYRITYEQLRDAGFDLAGVRAQHIAITEQGEPVNFMLYSRRAFGPGAFIEFYGEALDTLYTDTAVYQLQVNRGLTKRSGLNLQQPDLNAPSPAFYMETVEVDDNAQFSVWTKNGDPWYKESIKRSGSNSTSKSYPIALDHVVAGAGVPAGIDIKLWGYNDDPADPDHHVQVAVNNSGTVAEAIFDGWVNQPISGGLDAQFLTNGENQVTITLNADTGASYSKVMLDSYALSYPRQLVAHPDGSLVFQVQAEHIRVDGLPTGDKNELRIYRINADDGRLVRLRRLVTEATGNGFAVSFRGRSDHADTYLVYATSALLTPGVRGIGQEANQVAGASSHDYVVIAHPQFINGDLQRLVDARTQQGYSVKVVNVLDLYERYTYGVFDPAAIRSFIRQEAADSQYFLLVGADCNDYRNYQYDCVSFIPTLYRAVGSGAAYTPFSPADPAFVDLDDDNVPDRIIARLPVRSAEELRLMVDKTLMFDVGDYPVDAVMSADSGFVADGETLIDGLPDGWSVNRAYVDAGLSAAKATLFDSLNSGSRLASYVGHSGPQNWSWQFLLASWDAASLTNVGLPSLVTQWGCSTTYFVEPEYNTLAQQFMLAEQDAGPTGAAAVLGASTFTLADAEREMGRLLIPKLVQPGMTVGQAVFEAKKELAQTHPHFTDILLGYQLLGDGALMLDIEEPVEPPEEEPIVIPTWPPEVIYSDDYVAGDLH